MAGLNESENGVGATVMTQWLDSMAGHNAGLNGWPQWKQEWGWGHSEEAAAASAFLFKSSCYVHNYDIKDSFKSVCVCLRQGTKGFCGPLLPLIVLVLPLVV